MGVALFGGYITGALTLTQRSAVGDTLLVDCHFDLAPKLRGAKFTTLALNRSYLPALKAQGIHVLQHVSLHGAIVTGTTDLNGANIGGQLICDGSLLTAQNGDALSAQGIEVNQDLLMRGAEVMGMVRLTSAKIGGQFDSEGAKLTAQTGDALKAQGMEVAHVLLRGAKVTGSTNLIGAKIDGYLDCEAATFDGKGGDALSLQRASVGGALVWRNVTVTSGMVMLAAATVGDLWDDLASWPRAYDPNLPSPQPNLHLDGFTYTGLFATTTRAKDRLPWLAAGSYWEGTFTPQPYTHLAKVLREMGHDREARIVLFEREKLLAQNLYEVQRKEYVAALQGDQTQRADAGWIWLSMMGARAWAALMRRVTGYGYAPQYALFWALGCVGLGTMLYFIGYAQGLMVPNSAVILTSGDWATAFGADAVAPALEWQGQAAAHYETFYPIPYALDVFLPVVDLGQHAAWTQTTVTNWGVALRVFTWALQGAGYLITGLGLAAATGIIQKDRD